MGPEHDETLSDTPPAPERRPAPGPPAERPAGRGHAAPGEAAGPAGGSSLPGGAGRPGRSPRAPRPAPAFGSVAADGARRLRRLARSLSALGAAAADRLRRTRLPPGSASALRAAAASAARRLRILARSASDAGSAAADRSRRIRLPAGSVSAVGTAAASGARRLRILAGSASAAGSVAARRSRRMRLPARSASALRAAAAFGSRPLRLLAGAVSAERRAAVPPITAPLVTLVALQAIVVFAFLLIEPTPRWIVLFGAAVGALAFRGVLAGVLREPFESRAGIAPYFFLPTLYMLVMPVFVEETVDGLWLIPAGFALTAGLAAVLAAELGSARRERAAYHTSRVIAALGTYAVAFALFDLGYLLDLGLREAVFAAGVGGALLCVELMREGDLDPLENLGFAAIIGLVAAEARWVLHYFPLEGELAALALLFVLFSAGALLHAHRTMQLSGRAALEYSAIGAAGLALIIGARLGGIA